MCGIAAGDVDAKTDFCVPKNAGSNVLGPSLYSDANQNRPRGPLAVCQGDCDLLAGCQAGLTCFQRNRGQPVPGCRGFDGSRTDYCIDPGQQATPSFPVSTSNQVIMFLNYTTRVNDRRPTNDEYNELVVQTDKWFTDETDRIFGSDNNQLQGVAVTILDADFRPNQSASQQIRYSVTVSWTAVNMASVPADLDIVAAFQFFPLQGGPFQAAGRYNTDDYRTVYLIQLPNSNPFSQTTVIGQGMLLSP